MTRKRILIVDDEIGCTRLLKVNLELTNLYEVRVENRPEKAIQSAHEFKPDMILLDLVMPSMSGPQVARALQSDSELNRVPLALMTAADSLRLPLENDPVITGLPRITKPACMEEILKCLNENLSSLPIPSLAVVGEAAPSYEARL